MERARSPLTRVALTEHGLAALAVFVAGLGFWTLYDSWRFAPAVAIAVIAATAMSVGARWQNVPLPVLGVASLAALLVVGSALVERRVPPLGIADFVGDAARSWRLTLDTATPLTPAGTDLLVPFVSSWLAAALTGELVARTRTPALPLVGPVALLAVAILFGSEDDELIVWIGSALFVLGVLVVLTRGSTQVRTAMPRRSPGVWAIAGIGIAASMLVAPLVADHLPLASSDDRFSLRDTYEQSFDPSLLPSPLAQVKEYLLDDASAIELFRISGPPIERIRLATLGTYNGVVWGLDSRQSDLRPISSTLPNVGGEPQDGPVGTYDIEVINHAGPWLPVPGTPTMIEAGGGLEQTDFRFDTQDANVFSVQRKAPGQTYRITTRPVPMLAAEGGQPPLAIAQEAAGFGPLGEVAQSIVSQAGAVDTAAQLAALRQWFDTKKFFDPEAKPGHNLAALTTFITGDELIGFEEQYAAAFAVMARSVGIDARVVVGYEVEHVDETTTVLLSDLRAWNEVRTADGWSWLDITPDQNKTATNEVDSRAQEAGAFPAAPPQEEEEEEEPPPTTVAPPVEEDAVDDAAEDSGSPFDPGLVGYLLIALAAVISVLAVAVAVVVLLKHRRRARRRKAAVAHSRVTGAWRELVDLNVDFGYDPSPGSTIQERAVAMTAHARVREGEFTRLADGADRSSFDVDEPDGIEADALWAEFDRVEQLVMLQRPRRARMLARARPRSLRSRRARSRGVAPL